jgi:hypothetical protein
MGRLFCLFVSYEDKNYAVRWMVEGALALKKVCGMDRRRKHKKQV